jgi:hypothetical protein
MPAFNFTGGNSGNFAIEGRRKKEEGRRNRGEGRGEKEERLCYELPPKINGGKINELFKFIPD